VEDLVFFVELAGCQQFEAVLDGAAFLLDLSDVVGAADVGIQPGAQFIVVDVGFDGELGVVGVLVVGERLQGLDDERRKSSGSMSPWASRMRSWSSSSAGSLRTVTSVPSCLV